MSRRHPPGHRWHVGDDCRLPWYRVWPSGERGRIGGWHPAKVVGVRGDQVVVSCYGYESVRPWWELRKPPRHKGLWVRWWSHDKRAGRV
jgi:hypothetical protein